MIARTGLPTAESKQPGARNRPRSALRHYAGLLAPRASSAGRVALERGAGDRLNRLAHAAADRAAQRRRPTRPAMRALTASPGGRLHWTSAPAPPLPGPEGAIVRPLAVATCDLDPLIAFGASPFPLPVHLGHECVAEVVETGARVATVTPGQRVIVPFQISCGTCPACRAGHTGNCQSVPPVAMYGFGVTGGHWGGAYSDLLAVPYADAMLVPLPPGVAPATAASVADNVSDAYRHVAPYLPRLRAPDARSEILIIGSVTRRTMFAGSVPLYVGLIARALGVVTVTVVDRRPAVAAQARRLGLDVLHPKDLRGHKPATLVADISAHPAGHRLALAATAPDGICSNAGTLHRATRIPTLAMYARNATLHLGRAHARTLIPPVLDLVTSGRLHPETVTTTLDSLDNAPEVLRDHFASGGVKAILVSDPADRTD
ncbi:MAG TPA: alcohol dehydrogenase catalytic domain-containing protein [Streptosporangiaceae bacterium]|nr:alcohol dehydrogenase catalytic domain-containing protein [Streptosporangiaceae bacterium]